MLNFAKTLLDYKDQERTNHIFLIVSLLISIAYISIRFVDNIYFAKPNLGDEWFFYRDFSYYLMNGYYDSVLNGTSIPLLTEIFAIDCSFANVLSNTDSPKSVAK